MEFIYKSWPTKQPRSFISFEILRRALIARDLTKLSVTLIIEWNSWRLKVHSYKCGVFFTIIKSYCLGLLEKHAVKILFIWRIYWPFKKVLFFETSIITIVTDYIHHAHCTQQICHLQKKKHGILLLYRNFKLLTNSLLRSNY